MTGEIPECPECGEPHRTRGDAFIVHCFHNEDTNMSVNDYIKTYRELYGVTESEAIHEIATALEEASA